MNDMQELMKWAENIPMEELWSEIRRITGLSNLTFTHKITERNGYVHIKFDSQDLVDLAGFLKIIFKELTISNFVSEVKYKAIDDNKEVIPTYWGTANISYTSLKGSNGCDFLTFWYDDRTGWKFALEM